MKSKKSMDDGVMRHQYGGSHKVIIDGQDFDCDKVLHEFRLETAGEIRFINCSFNKGMIFSGAFNKVEFVNCVGTLKKSSCTIISLDIIDSEIEIERCKIGLSGSITVKKNSILKITGPGEYKSDSLVLDDECELVIESAKCVFDNVSLNNDAYITLDDTKDFLYPELLKKCELKGEKITGVFIIDCGFSKGFIRSIGSKSICFNGHIIGPEKDSKYYNGGVYKNNFMSVAYLVN